MAKKDYQTRLCDLIRTSKEYKEAAAIVAAERQADALESIARSLKALYEDSTANEVFGPG